MNAEERSRLRLLVSEARKAQLDVRDEKLRHGLYYTYARQGCRCAECRKANADYTRLWRRRAAA